MLELVAVRVAMGTPLAATTQITPSRPWRGEAATSGAAPLAATPLRPWLREATPAATTGVMGAGRTATEEHGPQPTTSAEEVVPDQTITMPPMTAMVALHMASLGIAMEEGRATIRHFEERRA